MDAQVLVSEYEARADAVALSIDDLCRRAGINRATWQRWKAGTSSPTLRRLTMVNSALERAERKWAS